MGDPAGIGPEIAVKALSEKKIYDYCRPIIIGDLKVLKKAKKITNLDLNIKAVSNIDNAQFKYGIIDVVDLNNVDLSKIEFGEVSEEAGDAAFEYVVKIIELAMNNQIDATVTGPIHKESINKAGHHFSGHTEIFAKYTSTEKYAMLLIDRNLRVIHVTTHVSLRKACDLVKKERVLDVIKLLDNACKLFGINKPEIAVAGLNPHASDGGLFGNEEKKEIIPAIQAAKREGINAKGPYPSDTLFLKAKQGLYDGCVAMYHDQGHIPVKLEGFVWDNEKQQMSSVKGVNITLGLPIIRVSVDHGTAFEIAGKGIASQEALNHAIEYAYKMAINKSSSLTN